MNSVSPLFTVLLYLCVTSNILAQTVTAYDMSPGPFNGTPVPKEVFLDPADNEPVIRFGLASNGVLLATMYVEARINELEAFRTSAITPAQFYIDNSIVFKSTNFGPSTQLFRDFLNFSDTKGILLMQHPTTTAEGYFYRTNGNNRIVGTGQTSLDDFTPIDSFGRLTGYVEFNGKILMAMGTDAYGIELVVMDDTYASDTIDINTGVADAAPGGLYNWGDSLVLFVANDGTNGKELWRTNGTAAGTMMLKDINSSGDATPNYLTEHNGKIYFSADDGNGRELWVTDGTTAGTQKVIDLNSTTNGFPLNLLSVPGGLLYFSIIDDTGDRRLYKTDGTSIGTSVVSTAYAVGQSNSVVVQMGGNIYFAGFPVADQTTLKLYKTDGTTTELVYGVPSGNLSLSFIWAVNCNYLYFTATDSLHGTEPYRTDGTTAGTILLADIGDSPSYYPNYMTAIPGGGICFLARDSTLGYELYIADLGLSNCDSNGTFSPVTDAFTTRLYPNPSIGSVNIELQNSGTYRLTLMDVTGKTITNQTTTTNGNSLIFDRPTAANQAGIYFLNVVNANGASQTLKLVYY